jgi:hypothetical protein
VPPKATECDERAKQAPSPLDAEAWLKLARQWRELADWIRGPRPNLLNNLSHGTACFAFKHAFGMTGLQWCRLKVWTNEVALSISERKRSGGHLLGPLFLLAAVGAGVVSAWA